MIIKPFNTAHIGLFVFAAAAVLFLRLILRGRSEKARKLVLIVICCVNIVCFFAYKFALSRDAEFLAVSGIEKFNWFNELPIQLCNINMFLIPIGLIAKKRPILGFSFFVAPLGAAMALFFPEAAFNGYSLFLPRMLGFCLTHLVILICGISLAALGLYRPKFSDFPGILITFICLAIGAHCVNLILRATVCPYANYFFTYHVDISILNLFWSWIHLPLLYLLPGIVILLAYMLLVSLLFFTADVIREKKKAAASAEWQK